MSIHAEDEEPIHGWFELTYANYVAIPRSVLQSMPVDWQRKFVLLMDELDATIDWRRPGIEVSLRDEKGRYMRDELVDYERGRRRIPHKSGPLPVQSEGKHGAVRDSDMDALNRDVNRCEVKFLGTREHPCD